MPANWQFTYPQIFNVLTQHGRVDLAQMEDQDIKVMIFIAHMKNLLPLN